jgi:hypothetical protein
MTKRVNQPVTIGQQLFKIFGLERNFDAIALEVSETLRSLRTLQPILGLEPAHIMVHVEGSTHRLFSLGARESERNYISKYITEAELWVENKIPSKAKWVLHVLSDKFLDDEPVRLKVIAHADYEERIFRVQKTELITDRCGDLALVYRLQISTLAA